MSFSGVNEVGRSRSLSLPTQNLSSYNQKRSHNQSISNPNSVRIFAEGEDNEATSLLRADEIENCRQVYFKYYNPKYGRISLWQLRKALKDLEIQPAEEELFKIIQTIEESENMHHQQHGLVSPASSSYNNGDTTSRLSKSLVTGEGHFQKFANWGSTVGRTGAIDFEQFLTIIVNQRKQDRPIHDNDTLSAFVAMGGNSDRTGAIQTEKLTAACEEFGLTIDIDSLIKEVDDDGNGTVDFDEFTMMLRTNKTEGDEDEDSEYE